MLTAGSGNREAKAGVITKPHGSALGLDHGVVCAFGKVEIALTFGTAEVEGQGGKVGGARRGSHCWVYCFRYMHPQRWFGLLLLLDLPDNPILGNWLINTSCLSL